MTSRDGTISGGYERPIVIDVAVDMVVARVENLLAAHVTDPAAGTPG